MNTLKIVGLSLSIISLLLLITILILSFVMPVGFWMGVKSAEKDYDDWVDSASDGDEIKVIGEIAEKDSSSFMGISIYRYRFDGCDEDFVSSEDIGQEGETVIVTVENGEMGPEARMRMHPVVGWMPNLCCGILTLLITVAGLIVLLIGFGKK